MASVLDAIRVDRARVHADPLSVFCLVGGDFNFVDSDSGSLRIDSGLDSVIDDSIRVDRHASRPLASALSQFTEHVQPVGSVVCSLSAVGVAAAHR